MVKGLFNKYREVILYLFFGVCTTLVNVASYYICTRLFHIHLLVSTVVAWFLSVVFAYVTNRKYVFVSKNTNTKGILLEFVYFVFCRLFTGALDFGNMVLFVEVLKLNDFVIKILSNVIVVLANYIASKLFIFNSHSKNNED